MLSRIFSGFNLGPFSKRLPSACPSSLDCVQPAAAFPEPACWPGLRQAASASPCSRQAAWNKAAAGFAHYPQVWPSSTSHWNTNWVMSARKPSHGVGAARTRPSPQPSPRLGGERGTSRFALAPQRWLGSRFSRKPPLLAPKQIAKTNERLTDTLYPLGRGLG